MRKGTWQQVYVCGLCEYITSKWNRNVCHKCGGIGTRKERVARWVDTTTFWQIVTLKTMGYWELRDGDEVSSMDSNL